jgi:hypothetical protein
MSQWLRLPAQREGAELIKQQENYRALEFFPQG